MTDVLIVDDEVLIRTGLRAIIDAEPGFTVVGEAGDGAEVLPLVRSLRPDVVMMDVRMPAVDGIQATRTILGAVPDPPRRSTGMVPTPRKKAAISRPLIPLRTK